MAYVGNSPESETVLRLQARKSFSLGVWIEDQNGKPLDITGCSFRFVARKKVVEADNDDTGNLIANYMGLIQAPTLGYLTFNFQAAELDWTPGEYQYTITLSDAGFSTVIVQGVIQLEQNTEFTSMTESYVPGAPPTALRVVLRENASIIVRTGPTLAPGEALFTVDDERKLDEIYAGKLAEGSTLNADMIPDGTTKVIMTLAERNQLANLSLEWDDIIGKPDFGDIITHDVSEFILKGGINASTDFASGTIPTARLPIVSSQPGMVITTGAPVAGNPGRITLKYTP